MKYSGIGGQAVLEGIMMRNEDKYAVAVRKPDGEIALDVKTTTKWSDKHPWMGWPFIRGTFNFIESLKTGIGTLMYSASFFEEEEDEAKAEAETNETSEAADEMTDDDILKVERPSEEKTSTRSDKKNDEKSDTLVMVGALVFSLVFAIGLFSLLPVAVASGLKALLGFDSSLLTALIEGILRIAIFVGYVWAVSFMKDIKRTYMYHGSEHKCINCIESGLPLTVENVRKSSKEHKRCGTSFMLIVMVISVFVFMFVRTDTIWLRFATRILLLPVVAGLSYEFLRFAGTHDNAFINALSRPGMWLQGLTTKEPTDDMIEVAITAVEAVFDWRKFEEELEKDDISDTSSKCCR